MDVCGSRQPRTTCPTLFIFAIAHLHELQDGREDTRAAQERQACALWSVSQARRKAENVGGLVGVAVVAPQAFDHVERVWRPFQQLGELLVVEIEAGTLRRLCAGLPRLGVSLVSSAGQYRRWCHYRRLCASAELRMLAIPAGGLLVGMADAEHRGFVEWPAEDLYSEWQAVGAEAVAEFERWLAGDV